MSKPTKEDLAYFVRVRELGCFIANHFPLCQGECGGDVVVHHQLGCVRDHRKVMPLCNAHHSATTYLPYGYSVHKGTKTFEKRYTTQAEMVAWTQQQLGE